MIDVGLLLWIAVIVWPFAAISISIWMFVLADRDKVNDLVASTIFSLSVMSLMGWGVTIYELVQNEAIEKRPYDWLHAGVIAGHDEDAAEAVNRLGSMTFYEDDYMPEWAVADMKFLEPICEQTGREAALAAFERAIREHEIPHEDLTAWDAALVSEPEFVSRFWRSSPSWPQFHPTSHAAQIEFAESLLTLDRTTVRNVLKKLKDPTINVTKHDHFVLDELISSAFKHLRQPPNLVVASSRRAPDNSARIREWCVKQHFDIKEIEDDSLAEQESHES